MGVMMGLLRIACPPMESMIGGHIKENCRGTCGPMKANHTEHGEVLSEGGEKSEKSEKSADQSGNTSMNLDLAGDGDA